MDFHKEDTEVASKSSSQPLLSPDEFYYDTPQQPKRFRSHLLWVTHAIYLAAITGILGFFVFVPSSTSAIDCARQENAWSPALSAILPYKDTFFNGTLGYPSPFRGTPSPSVDAAWETLVRMDANEGFSISEEEYLKLGHPLDENVVRLEESQGGGIFAGLEVYHQMHCLNLIRQYTYPEYYQNRSITFTDPAELVRTHVDHCIEMLRQKLTCDADVGVIAHTWVSRRLTPWPDFNVRHRCRNFEGVVAWSERNQAPGLHRQMTRPSHIAGLDPPP